MKRVLQFLDNFWFAAAPARRLAMLRILVGAFALQYVARRYWIFVGVAGASPDLYEPVGLAVFFSEPISLGVFKSILLATLVANVCFLLGWWYRVTGPVFAALLLWLFCYRNSWSMI